MKKMALVFHAMLTCLLCITFLPTCGDDNEEILADALTWQDSPLEQTMTWAEASAYCQSLLIEEDGDWRLPTISELRSLIRSCDATVLGGECGVTDVCLPETCADQSCGGCEPLEDGGAYWAGGMGGVVGRYWSSSHTASAGSSWSVDFSTAGVSANSVDSSCYVRCVQD